MDTAYSCVKRGRGPGASELCKWLADDHGYDLMDVYQLLTQVGELYVGNMVDTTYSLVARCPKRYLNGA